MFLSGGERIPQVCGLCDCSGGRMLDECMSKAQAYAYSRRAPFITEAKGRVHRLEFRHCNDDGASLVRASIGSVAMPSLLTTGY